MRRILVLASIIFLVVVAWTGLWLWGAGQVRAQIDALANNPDLSLACDRLDIAGYPFRFDVTCTGAALARLDLTARLPEIKATARVYRPGHIIAFAQPPVRLSDAFFGTERQLDFEAAQASLRLGGWSLDALVLERFSAQLTGATLHDVLIGDTELASVGNAEFHLLGAGEAGLEGDGVAGFVSASALDYPEAEIANGEVSATVILNGFPDRPMAWAEPAIVADWIEGGGSADIEAADFSADGLEFHLTGEANIDANGRLNGHFDTRSKGVAERLDFEVMGVPAAQLLGALNADGEQSASFVIQNGLVFVPGLPVPLFEIDPLVGF